MIDRKRLLADCQAEAKQVFESTHERLKEVPALKQALKEEYDAAFKAKRTGVSFAKWLEERLEQVAASWVLACVFVRFLEDNDLVDTVYLSGSKDRLEAAEHEERQYFREHPEASHREYLERIFREAAKLPGLGDLLGEGKNPLWLVGPTGDGAKSLLALWRKREEDGALVHEFSDPELDTRFLGDLYQDLSEFARKQYALLQTPDFVEAFILDRTLEPAIEEFGLENTTLIDPACGSGHFLLGAFRRLVDRWLTTEPATPVNALVQRALDQVTGTDINPFAVAIARFRLLVEALKVAGIRSLAKAPDFKATVLAGDSLLHGRRPELGRNETLPLGEEGFDDNAHYYATERPAELRAALSRRYSVVVANPPYIVPKDKGLTALYRDRFGSCYRQYSLAVPFKERCFDLVRWQEPDSDEVAGFVGMITANSFMKREFGKKLIEEFFPRWQLTHVIDTSGAYIPGHGTPTVVLLGRGRRPIGGESEVRAVRGIRGEPSTPEDPAVGEVWTSIVRQVDREDSEGEFVSTDSVASRSFHQHPWSLAGGGAAELKASIERAASTTLSESIRELGFVCMTRADDVYFAPREALLRAGVPPENVIGNVEGDRVRDWGIVQPGTTLFPYDSNLDPVAETSDSPVHA